MRFSTSIASGVTATGSRPRESRWKPLTWVRWVASAETLDKVVRKLRLGAMPPIGNPRPAPAAYGALTSWLESEIDRAAAAHPNPGRTESLHRLNRTEYANVIRDLLHLEGLDPSTLLPADDASYGFDNIAGGARDDADPSGPIPGRGPCNQPDCGWRCDTATQR